MGIKEGEYSVSFQSRLGNTHCHGRFHQSSDTASGGGSGGMHEFARRDVGHGGGQDRCVGIGGHENRHVRNPYLRSAGSDCLGFGYLVPALSLAAVAQMALLHRRQSEPVRQVLDALLDDAGYVASVYEPGWRSMAYHVAATAAAAGMSLYLLVHGIVGLRTWAW
jgi:hypothetical protein